VPRVPSEGLTEGGRGAGGVWYMRYPRFEFVDLYRRGRSPTPAECAQAVLAMKRAQLPGPVPDTMTALHASIQASMLARGLDLGTAAAVGAAMAGAGASGCGSGEAPSGDLGASASSSRLGGGASVSSGPGQGGPSATMGVPVVGVEEGGLVDAEDAVVAAGAAAALFAGADEEGCW
jgi:hypothetical protein